jgi:hypothetical protein
MLSTLFNVAMTAYLSVLTAAVVVIMVDFTFCAIRDGWRRRSCR